MPPAGHQHVRAASTMNRPGGVAVDEGMAITGAALEGMVNAEAEARQTAKKKETCSGKVIHCARHHGCEVVVLFEVTALTGPPLVRGPLAVFPGAVGMQQPMASAAAVVD